jgi:hypothetical protein
MLAIKTLAMVYVIGAIKDINKRVASPANVTITIYPTKDVNII